LEPELASLASAAGAALVTSMTTDAWDQVKVRFLGLWRRTRPRAAEIIEADLDNARFTLSAPEGVGYDALTETFVSQWSSRIGELLVEHSEIRGDLVTLINDLYESFKSDERDAVARMRIKVKNSGHGTTNVLGNGIQLNFIHE
jgi:hypothetical protein